MLFNFLIGGVTGVFLSDVPVNVTVHGSFFVLSHFHYTIMGGLIFALFAGFYYWFPKITGKTMNRKLSKWHFWTFFIFFNLTFFPMFFIGILGQPRRVFEYATNLQTLNDISSFSAYFLGASFLFFIVNFIWSIYLNPHPAPPNPWNSLGLEWQTPTPVPWFNFEHIPVVTNDPYHYGEPDAAPWRTWARPMAAVGAPAGSVRPEDARRLGTASRATATPGPRSLEAEEPWHTTTRSTTQQFESFPELHETPEEIAFELRAQEGALWTGGRLLIGIWAFAFAALAFAYFYLRSANNEDLWRPRGITAPTGTRRRHLRHHGGRAPCWSNTASAGSARTRRWTGRWRAGPPCSAGCSSSASRSGSSPSCPFFPGSSGYASCFIAWAAMNIAVVLCGDLLDRDDPRPRAPAAPGHGAGRRCPRPPPFRWPACFRANLNGCTYFWGFVAVVATFFWVLFYVI